MNTTVTLPAAGPEQPAPDPQFSDARAEVIARPERRILLIEDSALLRNRLVEMLAEPGLMSVAATAATEAEAIAHLDAAHYDVLLVDVQLRIGTGIGVIRHARRVYDADHQPLIIVLTNYPLAAVRTRCMEAGADHFLDKLSQFQDVKPLITAGRAPVPRH